MKILIMAGGKGTRLWPLSREQKPKQFQKLVSDRTMLQDTFFRLSRAFNVNDIYVATNEKYFKEVVNELPKIKKRNIIREPANRDTASCVALACAIIGRDYPKEILAIMPSDHLIEKSKNLNRALKAAQKFLEKSPEYLITLGVVPSSPETGFGYIQKNGVLSVLDKARIYFVKRFVEKPEPRAAYKFVESGDYFWNAGVYVARIDNLISQFEKYIPDTFKRILRIQKSVATNDFGRTLAKEYCKMDKISFDYGIAENMKNIGVIPVDLGWSDIGSWTALKKALIKRDYKHLVKAEHLDIGSKDLLVYGSPKKLIATVGLKGLIIVDTDDVILICDKSKSQDVKKVVEKVEKIGKNRHL